MTPRKSRAKRPIRIEQQVCFSLHAAARAYDALYRELLAPHGLSYPQYLVLIVLGQSKSLTVNEIGAALRLDSGTLSPLLKRLEAAGLVTRQRDPGDERRVRVSLTSEGEHRLDDVSDVQLEVARSSGLGMDQLEGLMGVLRATTASVDSRLGANSQ